jgi:hypothetical protein
MEHRPFIEHVVAAEKQHLRPEYAQQQQACASVDAPAVDNPQADQQADTEIIQPIRRQFTDFADPLSSG